MGTKEVSIPEHLKRDDLRFSKVYPPSENVNAPGKQPVGKAWNTPENVYHYDDEALQEWIEKGGNYGVVTGYGHLVVIDEDTTDMAWWLGEHLPDTFRVRSGSGNGYHDYYIVEEEVENTKLYDREGNEIGDLLGQKKQAIGPSSKHPSGNKYEIIIDQPIATISKEELLDALAPFLEGEKAGTQTVEVDPEWEERFDEGLKTVREVIRPCMWEWIKEEEPAHWKRHALTCELRAEGFPRKITKKVFQRCNFEDRDDDAIDSQVNQIYRVGYTPYQCKTIQQYGGCIGEDKCPLKREGLRFNEKDVFLWFKDLYMAGNTPRGTIGLKIGDYEGYEEENRKLSMQNLSSITNTYCDLYDVSEESKKVVKRLFVEHKKKAKEEALKESSDVEEEDVDLSHISEEQVESVIEGGVFPALIEKTEEIHKGDQELKMVSWISSLSKPLLSVKLNQWAVGESGKGKTHCLSTIFQTIPSRYKVKFNSCSMKAPYYYCKAHGEDSLRDKVVFFDEAEASEDATVTLRALTDPSQETIRHNTVMDQAFVDIVIKGTPVVWFTSVDPLKDGQLKNRFFMENPDVGSELDEKVEKLQREMILDGKFKNLVVRNKKFPLLRKVYKKLVDDTQDLRPVYLFNYEWMRKADRRLQPMFSILLGVITKINYTHRYVTEENVIIGSLWDMLLALFLWDKFERLTYHKLREVDLQVLEELPSKMKNAKTRRDISNETDKSYNTIKSALGRLLDADLVKTTGEGHRGDPLKYWKKTSLFLHNVACEIDWQSFTKSEIEKRLKEADFLAKDRVKTKGEGWYPNLMNHLAPSNIPPIFARIEGFKKWFSNWYEDNKPEFEPDARICKIRERLSSLREKLKIPGEEGTQPPSNSGKSESEAGGDQGHTGDHDDLQVEKILAEGKEEGRQRAREEKPSTKKEKFTHFCERFKYLAEHGNGEYVTRLMLYEETELTNEEVDEFIKREKKRGGIYEPKRGRFKLVPS